MKGSEAVTGAGPIACEGKMVTQGSAAEHRAPLAAQDVHRVRMRRSLAPTNHGRSSHLPSPWPQAGCSGVARGSLAGPSPAGLIRGGGAPICGKTRSWELAGQHARRVSRGSGADTIFSATLPRAAGYLPHPFPQLPGIHAEMSCAWHGSAGPRLATHARPRASPPAQAPAAPFTPHLGRPESACLAVPWQAERRERRVHRFGSVYLTQVPIN